MLYYYLFIWLFWISGLIYLHVILYSRFAFYLFSLKNTFNFSYSISFGYHFVYFCIFILINLFSFGYYLVFCNNYFIFKILFLTFFFSIYVIIILIFSYIMILVWEIIGFISFKLIGHWSHRSAVTKSSYSAMIFNRLGEVILLISLSLLGNLYWVYSNNLILFYVFVTFSCKSILSFSFLWLPEAMEGPTPVSSLLHSCTLVMAGIFCILKYKNNFNTELVIFIFFIYFYTNLPEVDFKRLIAYSTVSMVFFLTYFLCFNYYFSIFMIILIHATYKSSYFINLGKIIAETNIYTLNMLFFACSALSLFYIGFIRII